MKALSPGINDTTTALMCVDYLSAIMTRLASRKIERPYQVDEGELRLIMRGPGFQSLLAEAFDQIRQNAAGNVTILTRQLETLEIVASNTTNGGRRQSLWLQAELIAATAARSIPARHDCEGVEASLTRLSCILDR